MPSQTIRAEKIREVLAWKLGQATTHLHEIREADAPRWSRYQDPRVYVTNFTLAARGVYASAQSFATERIQQSEFQGWMRSWEQRLVDQERELWENFANDRRAQEHGEGASLVPIYIEIAQSEGMQMSNNAAAFAALGIPYQRPKAEKAGVRFAAYPLTPASEVCQDYLALCRRFADDFLQAHRHLLAD